MSEEQIKSKPDVFMLAREEMSRLAVVFVPRFLFDWDKVLDAIKFGEQLKEKVTVLQANSLLRALKPHELEDMVIEEQKQEIDRLTAQVAELQKLAEQADANLIEYEKLRSQLVTSGLVDKELIDKLEWLCKDCRTIFSNSTIPNMPSCVICPKCGGLRGSRRMGEREIKRPSS